MTKEEYADYQERVAFYLSGVETVSTGPCPGCQECGVPEDAEEYESEPFFSWQQCEICKSTLGGDREHWHALIKDTPEARADGTAGRLVHGTCCADCVYYLAYGRLDDTTMETIENS